MKMLSGYIAVGLWVLAVTLMAFGTDECTNGATCVLGFAWGLFVATVALGFTTWVLSERRDGQRVSHIVELVDALHDRGGSGPRRLR